jgi:hypothetical protein
MYNTTCAVLIDDSSRCYSACDSDCELIVFSFCGTMILLLQRKYEYQSLSLSVLSIFTVRFYSYSPPLVVVGATKAESS